MKERKYYLDFIRIFACFMVIVNHNLPVHNAYGNISINKWIISDFYFSLCKTAIPLFLIISGSLLLPRPESYGKYTKRIVHYIFLLFSWHIFDAIFMSIYKGTPIGLYNILGILKIFYYHESSWHMWYMYLIIGIYIFIPFIRKIVTNMKKEDWILYIILYLCFGLIPTFLNRMNLGYSITWNKYFLLPSILEYYGLYVLAPLIDSIPLKKIYVVAFSLIGIISEVINISVSTVYTIKDGSFSYIFDWAFGILTVSLSISIFYIFKYIFSRICLSGKTKVAVVEISACTFGIYLLHPYVTYILLKIDNYVTFIESPSKLSIHMCIIKELILFTICLGIVMILRRIPLIKRLVS